MNLEVISEEATLFEIGEVYEAALIPSVGTGRAVLILEPGNSGAQWVSPSQAAREGLGVVEATKEELVGLRAAGYRLPVLGRRESK